MDDYYIQGKESFSEWEPWNQGVGKQDQWRRKMQNCLATWREKIQELEVCSNRRGAVGNAEEHGNDFLIEYIKEGEDNDDDTGHGWECKIKSETKADSNWLMDKTYPT